MPRLPIDLTVTHDFLVVIKRKPEEKLVTIRHASQTMHTSIESLKRHLEEHGTYEDERYVISLRAPKRT
jgi:hypothetical protein